MSYEVLGFENELRSKISHKSSSFQSEEGFLVKQFKFFDIYNKGILDFNNFYRTVEKIGIIMDKEDVRMLFPQLNGVEGEIIHYRQYAKNLYSDSAGSLPVPAPSGQTYSPSKHGVFEDDQPAQASILRSGMNSQDYPLATTTHLYKPSTSAGRKSVLNPDYINKQSLESLETYLKQPDFDAPQESESDYTEQVPAPNFDYGHVPAYYEGNLYTKFNASKSQMLYIERFKEQLIQRGGRGLIGLLKQFKIFDTDASGHLDRYEFRKAVEDYEVDVHPKDLDNLFNSFDTDHNERIDYGEFINAIAGPMTKYRLQLVERAFDKLDTYKEGEIEINDMFACYDAYRHPDIASGKSDPESAFNEFKDTFEVYHGLVHNYNTEAKVTRDEFTDYFTYISSEIKSDSQFDIMINGVWNIDNKNNYDEMPYAGAPHKVTKVDSHSSWLNDHHRKMIGGADHDVISSAKNQYSWQTTHTANFQSGIPTPSVSAGVPTWPVGAFQSWQGGLTHHDQREDYMESQYHGYGQQ